ncbi:MAG: radical SAM protein [Gammaproteobacteria bacterium]
MTRQRNGFLSGYTHSLNPYMGCAFGARGSCPFCYVRALPVALAGGGLSWGDWVMAKSNAPELLRRELLRLSARGERPRIFFSSSTDPYQGAEARLRITRRLLEVFAELPDTFEAVLLQTRSPLVERDTDLLLRMRDQVLISLTLETDDDEVRRALTPLSPSVSRRLATLERLTGAGLRVQAAVAPVLPCNPERFAALLSGRVARVLVDTFFAGDGSGGRRSTSLGMGEILARLGHADWFKPDAHLPLMQALFKCISARE